MNRTYSKHICFIGAGLAGGGMERALVTVANYAASKNYKVTIINLFITDIFFDLHPDIKLIWPQIDRAKNHRLVYAAKLIPYLRSTIKNIKPDTILSFGEWFNGYVILATLYIKIPIFVTDRMGPLLNLGFIVENARKILYKRANGIIAQSEIAAKILANKTKSKKIKVIPNALNQVDVVSPIKKNSIVCVGRLSREKGQDILIQAFASINDKNWKLDIVGDGPTMNNLIALSKTLKIEDKVIFHGHLKEFSNILGEAKIFVLPSLYEGFPNALIEAMSVPLACISSNCIAGPSDIIKHGINGMLVETGSVDELSKALNILINNEELQKNMAQEAYSVRKKYDKDIICSQYIDFILN